MMRHVAKIGVAVATSLMAGALSAFECSATAKAKARDFIDNEKQFHLGFLPTEQSNPITATLEEDFKRSTLAGVQCLQRGDRQAAANYFRRANTPEAKANLGLVDLLDGKYDSAARQLKDGGMNAAIANILAGNLDAAEAAVTCKCAKAEYIRAIIAARRGNATGVRTHLEAVAKQDPKLYERSRTDAEFALYR